jgi:hypothetical protein
MKNKPVRKGAVKTKINVHDLATPQAFNNIARAAMFNRFGVTRTKLSEDYS